MKSALAVNHKICACLQKMSEKTIQRYIIKLVLQMLTGQLDNNSSPSNLLIKCPHHQTCHFDYGENSNNNNNNNNRSRRMNWIYFRCEKLEINNKTIYCLVLKGLPRSLYLTSPRIEMLKKLIGRKSLEIKKTLYFIWIKILKRAERIENMCEGQWQKWLLLVFFENLK